MPKVSDQLTPVTPGEVLVALGAAWRRTFDPNPRRESLLVLLAQWALETGRGKSMHCFNLGNIKSKGEAGDWCFFRCNEIIEGKLKWFDPEHPACRFRAYSTLEDGALDYLKTLHERFKPCWSAVLEGDPAKFSHLLKVNRYYTADEGQYTATMKALFQEFQRRLPLDGVPGDGLPDLFTTLGVQTALQKLRFDPGTLDGKNGPDTEAAVERFQAAHGLLPDGIVGRLTRAALADALNR